VTGPDIAALRAAYDEQLRVHVPGRPPDGVEMSWDGPLLRTIGFGGRGWVEYRDLGGADGDAVDGLIARQVRYFGERGQGFEWKAHGHDLPADLTDRLRAAGFVAQPTETIMIGALSSVDLGARPPEAVVVREVTDASERGDLRGITALEGAVWGEHDTLGWIDHLAAERAADPGAMSIFVAEAAGLVVSAGWIRFPEGTDFGTLWGGATLREWRGRGIYRSLVAQRGRLAAARGLRYLETDASDDSRPILQRLGFVPVTTTTPWNWSPRP
jgi:GNAT superfamily N-acetyltransferase